MVIGWCSSIADAYTHSNRYSNTNTICDRDTNFDADPD
jgi:hypothetical protein